MAKPNPLAQGLESLSKPALQAAEPTVASQTDAGGKPAKVGLRAPSREGQTLVGGFFAPPVHKQLKVLAAETGITQQALLAEALNMVFAKYGKPEIAELGRSLKATNA